MKTLFLILTFLFTTSCSSARMSRKHEGIDPKIQPYIEETIIASKGRLTKEHFEDLTAGFKKYEKGTTAGTCWPMPWLTEIDISEDWWYYNQSSLARFELILHEVGHCILKRHHTEKHYSSNGISQWFESMLFKTGILKEKDKLYDGCPSSIMHPYVLSESCFMKHYLYYIEELFSEITYEEFSKKHSFNLYINDTCRIPRIVNKTNKWNEFDRKALERSKKRCIEIYGSCLKTFIKTNEQSYQVICE